MILSEEYKNRLSKLSGRVSCSNCFHSWDKEKGDKNPYLCHRCGYDIEDKKFRVDELKKWIENQYGSLEEGWSKKYKNIFENVGPGLSINNTTSNIFMDIFNQFFNSDDFKKEYNTDGIKFWFEDKENIKNQKSYQNSTIEKFDKKYRDLKKGKNWKPKNR
jgi:hypothetical protein